jgi:hypothetical protein
MVTRFPSSLTAPLATYLTINSLSVRIEALKCTHTKILIFQGLELYIARLLLIHRIPAFVFRFDAF